MLMHNLITYTLSPLLDLIFKISSHKVLLNYNTFSLLNYCITLIRLMRDSTNSFVLILINSIVSSFSRTLIVVFCLTLSYNIDIYSFIPHLLTISNILTLISCINSCIYFSCFLTRIDIIINSNYSCSINCILICFLILN